MNVRTDGVEDVEAEVAVVVHAALEVTDRQRPVHASITRGELGVVVDDAVRQVVVDTARGPRGPSVFFAAGGFLVGRCSRGESEFGDRAAEQGFERFDVGGVRPGRGR